MHIYNSLRIIRSLRYKEYPRLFSVHSYIIFYDECIMVEKNYPLYSFRHRVQAHNRLVYVCTKLQIKYTYNTLFSLSLLFFFSEEKNWSYTYLNISTSLSMLVLLSRGERRMNLACFTYNVWRPRRVPPAIYIGVL